MDWRQIRQLAETNLQRPDGGFSEAKRGTVLLPDGEKVFVKIAVDEQTLDWIKQEIHAYRWLQKHGYEYAPRMIASGEDGFALQDLSGWDWQRVWTKSKIDAALRAVDKLTELSEMARNEFRSSYFGETLWQDLPRGTSFRHLPRISEDLSERAHNLLADKSFLDEYRQLIKTNPTRGTDLVHFDVRADNFAYNAETDTGMLVDWNWLCLGSKLLDQTAFLVDVHKSYDVLPDYSSRLDKASLAWLVGFWLNQAAIIPDTALLGELRLFQLQSALCAHSLLQAIK